jgi:prepilin-type N-terminal cleavage/methylation domain-containing protein
MRRLRDNAGFTLIETLVAMVVSLAVFGATLSALDVFQNDNRLDQLHNEAQDSARTAIDALARELRNGAAPSSLTPGALEKAGKY